MIIWHDMNKKHPAYGEKVVVFSKYGQISIDKLDFGDGICEDESLVYWQSGCNFDDISHWADMINLPNVKAFVD